MTSRDSWFVARPLAAPRQLFSAGKTRCSLERLAGNGHTADARNPAPPLPTPFHQFKKKKKKKKKKKLIL